MKITTIGLDIAKNVFQVHGIDAAEKVVVRKQLRRGQVSVLQGAAALPYRHRSGLVHFWTVIAIFWWRSLRRSLFQQRMKRARAHWPAG